MAGLLMITNFEAGGTDDAAVDAAVQILASSYDVEVVQTLDLDQVASALSHRGDRDVAVVGGDGSLHAVADILHRLGDLEGAVIGQIPEGTGNDFARTLGLPLEAAGAAEVIAAGRSCRFDLLVDDADRVVVNAVHAGIGADAGQAARPWKWLGKAGYVVGAVVAGLTARGQRIHVVADGEVLADGRRRVLQVGIGNGAHIGGGFQLTPDADPTDGLADVLVSFAVRPVDRLLYGLHLRRGTHEERHDVEVTRAASVTLSGPGFWCDADGELDGPLNSRTWTVRRSALAFFRPSSTVPAPGCVDRQPMKSRCDNGHIASVAHYGQLVHTFGQRGRDLGNAAGDASAGTRSRFLFLLRTGCLLRLRRRWRPLSAPPADTADLV